MKSEETQFDECYQTISDRATEISQAYADFGDLRTFYLGQTSSTLQLRLFRPFVLELFLYFLTLLKPDSPIFSDIKQESLTLAKDLEHSEDTYIEDRLGQYDAMNNKQEMFIQSCLAIVGSDPLWLSNQRRDVMPKADIGDKGYVAIKKAALVLENLAAAW